MLKVLIFDNLLIGFLYKIDTIIFTTIIFTSIVQCLFFIHINVVRESS